MPNKSQASMKRLPTLYVPHGGGPCFFMEWTLGSRDTWDRMAGFLRTIPQRYPTARALLVASAHWEEPVVLASRRSRRGCEGSSARRHRAKGGLRRAPDP